MIIELKPLLVVHSVTKIMSHQSRSCVDNYTLQCVFARKGGKRRNIQDFWKFKKRADLVDLKRFRTETKTLQLQNERFR